MIGLRSRDAFLSMGLEIRQVCCESSTPPHADYRTPLSLCLFIYILIVLLYGYCNYKVNEYMRSTWKKINAE